MAYYRADLMDKSNELYGFARIMEIVSFHQANPATAKWDAVQLTRSGQSSSNFPHSPDGSSSARLPSHNCSDLPFLDTFLFFLSSHCLLRTIIKPGSGTGRTVRFLNKAVKKLASSANFWFFSPTDSALTGSGMQRLPIKLDIGQELIVVTHHLAENLIIGRDAVSGS